MKYSLIIRTAAVFSILLGVVVLVMWTLDSPDMRESYPGYTSVKVNTALCFGFVLYGTALLLFVRRSHRKLFYAVAGVITAIAALTVAYYVTGIGFGGRSLVGEIQGADNPICMYMITAIWFVLLSMGLIFSAAGQTRKSAGQLMFHAVSLTSFVAIAGYAFGVSDLFHLSIYVRVAANTSIAVFIISVCSSFINPQLGIIGMFHGYRIGNALIRRLYPTFFLLVILLTFGRILLHQNNLEVEFGIVLYALVFLTASLLLIGIAATQLNRIDAQREAAVFALEAVNRNLEATVDQRTSELKAALDEIKSRERQIKASHEIFLRMFHLSPVGMITSHGEGFPIQDVNDAFLRMIGRSREDTVGKNVLELNLSTPADLAEVVAILNDAGIIENRESTLASSTGEQRICLASAILFTANEVPMTFCTFLDISQRKDAESRLVNALYELSAQVEQVRELNTVIQHSLAEQRLLNEELTRTSNEKDNILAVVSHDLRNPIAGISSVARILTTLHELPRAADPLLQVIQDSCDDMMILTTNLLDLNKIERGKHVVNIGEFQLGDVFRKLYAHYDFRAKAKHITLKIMNDLDDDTVLSDVRIVYRILENLVSNAIKFTPHHGWVQVAAFEAGEAVTISVSDNGPGICSSQHHLLFHKFSKLSATPTGDEPSTGLGLSIVKELGNLIGGEIKVDSSLGEGSTFSFTFKRNSSLDS